MDFSKRVKELCRQQGIMVKELADRLGIRQTALSQTLHQPYPQLQTLERIAHALGVEVVDLFERTSDRKEATNAVCPHCGRPLSIMVGPGK